MARRAVASFAVAWLLVGAVPASAQIPPGMRQYMFGFLGRGPNAGTGTTEERERVQAGHIANIERMAAAGALVAAGPVEGDGDLRGIFIFSVASEDEVRKLTAADPSIQGQRLILDVHPWIGPAGIGERYKAEHGADPNAKTVMRTYRLALLRKGAADADPAGAAEQRAHLQHIAGMQAAGKLAAVGPMADNGDVQGVIVFTADEAETRKLVAEDPHVKAGRLKLDLHTWWCAEHVMPDTLPRVPE